MRRLRRFRPSPALVVASVALLVALGGTSIAAVTALPRNSVGTAQLKNNAVTSAKVKNRSLLAVDFASGQLPAGPAGPAGPQGPQGPAGPSNAYARFLNGPVAVPAALTTLANLAIPEAGSYVLWAKAYFTSAGPGTVTCRLEAGADFDQTQTWVQPGLPFALANLVAHQFDAAGSANFRCSATGTQQANYIKIAAIKVGSLSNSG